MKDIQNTERTVSYNKGAKFLHWSIVVLVVIQFISAWVMPGLRGATSPSGLVSLHLSFGLVVLLVMMVRVLWRVCFRPPKLPHTLTKFEASASHAVHYVLYLLLLILPVTGWAWASSRGWDATIFGFYTLPALVSSHSTYGRLAGNLHSSIATLVLIIVAGHVAAALYHYFVKNDGIMERMLFVRRSTHP